MIVAVKVAGNRTPAQHAVAIVPLVRLVADVDMAETLEDGCGETLEDGCGDTLDDGVGASEDDEATPQFAVHAASVG